MAAMRSYVHIANMNIKNPGLGTKVKVLVSTWTVKNVVKGFGWRLSIPSLIRHGRTKSQSKYSHAKDHRTDFIHQENCQMLG